MHNVEIHDPQKEKPKKKKRTFFERDEKGQIALFVALIFQIIFVLFALVINVGLLVHHKINLQQSTDLAAYYGAMKQAEILNVIGHLNFQMRQAWKLMTWRYRILGSFAYKPATLNEDPGVPILIDNRNLIFDETKAKSSCVVPPNGERIRNSDLTPFCIGHNGFGEWPAAPNSAENTCDTNCAKLQGGANALGVIPNITAISVQGASVASAIQSLIQTANLTGQELCRGRSLANVTQLSNILAAYFLDSENKKQSMNLLFAGLLAPADQMVDLDGESIKAGVIKTLENNLTDANYRSLKSNYKLFNSTSTDNTSAGSECYNREQLFHELKFQFVEFIINVCEAGTSNATNSLLSNTKFLSIFEPPTYNLNSAFIRINNAQSPASPHRINVADVESIIKNEFVLGYEKNPWCQNYFGVRATTEPAIPFLPLSKIKLHASSFAKPFGGTIGPWFYNRWDRGSDRSDSAVQVDKTMPPLRIVAGFGSTLTDKMRLLPNFSNYVGDKEGTRDPFYQAIFHDFLLTRSLNRESSDASSSHPSGGNGSPFFDKPSPNSSYPFFKNWRNVAKQISDPEYDPLAIDQSTTANSYIRDLEIAAIAPNQFDLAYYSIDPDFYNNYYKDRLDNNGPNRTVDKFKSLASGGSNPIIRPDYGYNQALSSAGAIPIDYSVRHQLAVVEQIFKGDATVSGRDQLKVNGMSSSLSVMDKYFTFIPRFQGSLLSGWTFKDLVSQDGYTQFPNVSSGTKMPFATCNDPYPSSGNPIYRSLVQEPGPLPPAPGNCFSGGRTGYSVKIISAPALNSPQGDIGGPGTGSGFIKNQIPVDFFDM